MTVSVILESVRDAASVLYNAREADAIAWLVLEYMGITKTGIITQSGREIDVPEDWDSILAHIRSGRPVQYVIGRTEFCGLVLSVSEGVLIPRPETEELIGWILERDGSAGNILDVGTGSGAIAISLAVKLQGANVRATDISTLALGIAADNAVKNRAVVEFLQADILAHKDRWTGKWEPESFDVIVSNPPYIPASDLPSIHTNVKDHEPHIALFVPDDDPLLFYRAVAENARWLLRCGGALYFEIYENFGSQMHELLSGLGFVEIELRADINGKNRMMRCMKK